MPDHVDAYDRETGQKRRIPADWLERNHAQFKRFSKTPRQRRRERDQNPAPEPDPKNTPRTAAPTPEEA